MASVPAAVETDPRKRPASFLQGIEVMQPDPASDVPGMPPNFGLFPLTHTLTFQSLFSSGAKNYRDSDEAIQSSLDEARYMRNDCGVMECVEARQRCVALLDWELQPEDETSHEQKELCAELTKIVKRIRQFLEYRYNLQHAIWYGKYAIQNRYGWDNIGGKMRLLPLPRHKDDSGWKPINGDKLVFRQDAPNLPAGAYPNQLGIRVGMFAKPGEMVCGRWNVETTERGAAYFLQPWERDLVVVHRHMVEDAAYEDALNAGSINGVGIRTRIYWEWRQKQESLAFLMEYLERSAGGIELWHYPEGNPQAKASVEESMRQRVGAGKNQLLVPIPLAEDGSRYGVQIIEPGMAGIDTLHQILKEYYGHRIKRYILGQVLSSESEATGLGSGVADLHLDTLMQIIRYDAMKLEETITFELIREIQKRNFPKSMHCLVKFHLVTESPDIEKKLEAWARAYEMGARLKERDVMDLIGASIPDGDDRVLQKPQPQPMGLGGPTVNEGAGQADGQPGGEPGGEANETNAVNGGAVDGMRAELAQQLAGDQ